jgi:alkylation response protein AidB-like acyl-CoA dehydrogenase
LEGVERGQGSCSAIFGRSVQKGRKIMDIFEGTQQIQQLIIARRLLGKTSAQLK